MDKFYHLSHFFEFLTGLNFGGLAILKFFQIDASAPFTEVLRTRETSAINARTQVREYYDIKITVKNGALRAFWNSFKWFLWCAVEILFNIFFSGTKFYINVLSRNNNFARKFFPVFFFTGLFTLIIVFFSGLEQEKYFTFSAFAINKFFLCFGLSTVIFQIWGTAIFPFLVDRKDYLLLTTWNVIISITLLFASVLLSRLDVLPFNLDQYFLPANGNKLLIDTVIVALVPISIIFIFSGLVLSIFVICTYFYNWTLHKFKAKTAVREEIQRFKP